MHNLVTDQHDFNKPIKFTAVGFTKFLDERDATHIAIDGANDVRGFTDALGNVFVFKCFPNCYGERVFAELLPDVSEIHNAHRFEKKNFNETL